MTKPGRILNLIIGLLMIGVGALLFLYPDSGLYTVAAIISTVISFRGFQKLWYYFTMARFMVGGRYALYQGILYLDAGLLTAAMSDSQPLPLILYIAGIQAFAGVVDILRGVDTRKIGGGRWKYQMAYGLFEIALSVAVAFTGLYYHLTLLAVCTYAAGVVLAGINRIINTFRKSTIVYIQ